MIVKKTFCVVVACLLPSFVDDARASARRVRKGYRYQTTAEKKKSDMDRG